jgi:hypothetical protein
LSGRRYAVHTVHIELTRYPSIVHTQPCCLLVGHMYIRYNLFLVPQPPINFTHGWTPLNAQISAMRMHLLMSTNCCPEAAFFYLWVNTICHVAHNHISRHLRKGKSLIDPKSCKCGCKRAWSQRLDLVRNVSTCFTYPRSQRNLILIVLPFRDDLKEEDTIGIDDGEFVMAALIFSRCGSPEKG